MDNCFLTDLYISHEIYEVLALVVSNLFLLLPLYKAWVLHERLRALLYLLAIIFSSLYHLCKTFTADSTACVLPLCSLRLLDYTFSYTILVSSFLFFLDFGAVYKHLNSYHTHSRRQEDNKFRKHSNIPLELGLIGSDMMDNSGKIWLQNKELKNIECLVKVDNTFIEDWLIISIGIYVAICVSQNNFTALTFLQMAMLLGVVCAIVVFGWIYLYMNFHLVPHYDAKDLVISLIWAILAITLFLVADYLPPFTYWITHSIWHIFGSTAQLYLLEMRNFRKSGWFVLCCDRINDY